MTTVEETVAHLQQELERVKADNQTLQRQMANVQPTDRKQDGLATPPTTYPLGAIPGDRRPRRIREREMAIEKMQQVARNHGGMWHPDPRVPSVYGHKPGDGALTIACDLYGEDEYRPSCQRTCWTPENETRFLHALGLKDLATGAPTPLTPPDPKDNHDAIRELVGLLKPAATVQDVTGQYPPSLPTREEVGTQQGAVRVRKIA